MDREKNNSMPDEKLAAKPTPSASAGHPPSFTHVLEQSLQPLPGDAELGQRAAKAMAAVAAKYRGLPFEPVPIGVEMVEGALKSFFLQSPCSANVWKPMSHPIVLSIEGDPVARERLRRLWSRLSEVQS